MEFKLTMEQEIIQKQAREFAQRELEPIAAQLDRDGKVPPDMTEKLVKAGFAGMLIPKQYGGSEAGVMNFVLAMEQLNYPVCHCLDAVSNNIVGRAIAKVGTEEQRQRYLPPLAKGKAAGVHKQSTVVTLHQPAMGMTKNENVGSIGVCSFRSIAVSQQRHGVIVVTFMNEVECLFFETQHMFWLRTLVG